jgi:molecular chaperone DnaK (HSP70)
MTSGQSPCSHAQETKKLILISLILGLSCYEPSLQSIIKELRYDVVSHDNYTSAKLHINGTVQYFTPAEILSHHLTHLRNIASAHLNQTVSSAVISVPSYFADPQQQIVLQAAGLAGLEVKRFISEETAAGIAHHIDTMITRHSRGEDNFLIYNLGEQESSIAVVSVLDGVLETIGLETDRTLGETHLEDEHLGHVTTPDRIQALVKQVLEDAKIDEKEVKAIVLTGNPSKTGIVQPILEGLLRGRKILQAKEFASDEAVVYGAALQAHFVSDDYDGVFPLLMDVTFLSLGIETQGGGFEKVIQRGTVIPTVKMRVITTMMDEQEKAVIIVLEGERLVASKNRMLGRLELNGLPKRRKGEVEIEVMFEVDSDGVLTIAAVEREREEKAKVVVMLDFDGFDAEEIDSIVTEAQGSTEEDEAILRELLKRTDLGGDEKYGVVIK